MHVCIKEAKWYVARKLNMCIANADCKGDLQRGGEQDALN